jgi:hypothetical protein
MKIKLLLICSIMLYGCGGSSSTTTSEAFKWSGKTSEQSANFIISYSERAYSSRIGLIEALWVSVQECAGIGIDISNVPLRIDYIDAPEVAWGRAGQIMSGSRIAQVVQSDLLFPRTRFMGWYTKHEMLHYLIYQVSGEEDFTHSHPFFESCINVVSPP